VLNIADIEKGNDAGDTPSTDIGVLTERFIPALSGSVMSVISA
jgi:hypothetical protein